MNYIIIFIILIVLVLISYSNIESFTSNNFDFIEDQRIEMIRGYFKSLKPKKKYLLSNSCNVKEYNRFDIEPSMEKYIKDILQTWNKRNIKPKFHVSEQGTESDVVPLAR